MREMKDSGVAWIGEIPADWQIVKFSRIASVKCNLVAPDDYLELPQISPENIEKGSGKLLSYKTVEESGIISGNHLFHKGQLLYSKIRPKLNKVCIAPFPGLCSADMYPIESKQNIRFLMYCMLSDAFVGQVSMITEDRVKMPKINQDELSSLLLAFPPTRPEQQAIANFLDSKCTEIDAVLEKTRTSIEEYKKLKQAIITQAVTKGVRGDRPMKESGIEWVGAIPKNWDVRRIKSIGTYRNGLTYAPEDQTDESGTLVLRSSNVQNGKLDFSNNVFVSCEIPAQLMVQKGDILICSRNGSRELIGKSAIIDSDICASFGAFMMIFRCECPRYMYYLLNSNIFSVYLNTFLTTTINQLTGKNFGNMNVVYCPDAVEQDEITSFLDRRCLELDELIAKKISLISSLESYKKSLIYEYVTGKKEVSV